jgi:pyruvate-ferredoxin/flavodoxin oxidoreductase
LATGKDVNVLVFDNEEYANTGGQASKATPLSAVTKFAAGGRRTHKKDLGLMAMTYGDIYVASVCLSANYNQVVQAILEAESYEGPSLIMGYCPCIDHNIRDGMGLGGVKQAKEAVKSGYWPLYRYDPRRKKEGKNPLVFDSPLVRSNLREFLKREGRYTQLMNRDKELSEKLQNELDEFVTERFEKLKMMAGLKD